MSSEKRSILTDPLCLMEFGMDSIMSYCDHVSTVCSPDLPLAFTKVHRKAASMFKDKFISNIEFVDKDDFYEIYAKVRAEMAKKKIYSVSATISKSNEVKSASCECPGGAEPSACKHSLALLYAVENYSQKELYAAPTELLQRWHQVKPKKTSPIKFSSACQISQNSSVNFSCLKELPFTAPIFDVLDNTLFNIDEACYTKSVPLPLVVPTNVAYCDYPENLNLEEIIFLHKNVTVSFEDAIALEKETVKQSNCDQWKNNRRNRLTSSLFFEICNSSNSKLPEKIFNSHSKDISDLPAVKYGLENEPLIQNVIKHKYNTFIFRKTGLTVNPFFPHLGASPDGLLHNTEDTFLIEIKCIYNPSNLSLYDLSKQRKDFCLQFNNEQFKLKKNHKYMYQIQGQLAISNLSKCLLVVMYKQHNPVYIEEIFFDASMWATMKKKLGDFYFKQYMPFLISHNM